MPENFLSMLHSYNQFKRPSGVFGMPSINRDDGLGEAYEIANQLKNEDLNRQREMLRFQQAMRIQDEDRARMNAELDRNKIDITGRKANKNYVTQYAPPTMMQQQFRQDELLKDQRAQAEKLALLQGDQRLQQALAVGKLNADRYAADRESRESIAEGNRTAQNLRAEADRKSREEIAETSRNSVQVMIGPDGKPHAIATNPRDATARALTIDGQPVGDVYNPGTRSKVATPEQQKGIDLASDALSEIDEYLLNPDDSLTDAAKWGTGGTAWTGYIPTTPGHTAQASLNRVAAERIVTLIGHMKSQSRTGATGMGNMSNEDRQVLENAATKLKNPWLDQEVIRKELVKVRNILRKTAKIEDAVSQPGRTQPRQSSFVPDPEAAAKLQHYSTTAGPAETASVYQPTRGALPITNQATAPAGTLRPQVQESLKVLQNLKSGGQ